jgi:hypothetical protein
LILRHIPQGHLSDNLVSTYPVFIQVAVRYSFLKSDARVEGSTARKLGVVFENEVIPEQVTPEDGTVNSELMLQLGVRDVDLAINDDIGLVVNPWLDNEDCAVDSSHYFSFSF